MATVSKASSAYVPPSKGKKILGNLRKDKWLYMMLVPMLAYYIIYHYGSMLYLLVAFKDYQAFLGFWGSKWVGLTHFQRLFSDRNFSMIFANTLTLSFLNLLFNFPMPIILALMLNEVKFTPFKRTVQTITYMPHFLSWTIIAGITYVLFTTEGGLINEFLVRIGVGKVNFLISEKLFRPMVIGQSMWRDTGWNTIIYLAAISGVDAELYEASRIDGATRFQQLWHITLPCIKTVVVTLFILRLGTVMNSGFEHLINMINGMNRNVGEVFDTFVYQAGIENGQFSYSTAVGLFKSVVGLILVVSTDRLAKVVGEEGLL